MSALLSCPFCGASEELGLLEVDVGGHAATCNQCGAIGPSDSSPDRAEMLWNGSALVALGLAEQRLSGDARRTQVLVRSGRAG